MEVSAKEYIKRFKNKIFIKLKIKIRKTYM